MQIFLKALGRKVALARQARQLTQKQAAKLANISDRYLQRIEAGMVNLTMATLLRIARPLKAHPKDLIPGSADWSWKD